MSSSGGLHGRSRPGGETDLEEFMSHHTPCTAQPGSLRPYLTLETSVSKAFMADAIGVRFERDYYFDPAVRRAVDARCQQYAEEHLRDLAAFYTESN